MRHLLILAAAAFLAVGCHQRTEDETGAAPDQGDATVTATDSASVQTDSTTAATTDTTAVTADTSAVTSDTTSMTGETTTVGVDSVGAQGEVQTSDTTAWVDSTAVEAPADTTKY